MSYYVGVWPKTERGVWAFVALTSKIFLGISSTSYTQDFEAPSAQDSASTEEISSQSGYEDVPEFCGPTSVGTQLKEDDAPKQTLYRFNQLQQFLSPYCGP